MPTPRVDLSLFNVRIYDVTDADIILGQDFSMRVQSQEKLEWFTNNDEVLNLKVTENTAEIKANSVGNCTILLMNSSRQIVRSLSIVVVNVIQPEADRLEMMADPAQPK